MGVLGRGCQAGEGALRGVRKALARLRVYLEPSSYRVAAEFRVLGECLASAYEASVL